jgi:Bacterial aa3 type cytochrome c oxidase subunit IV
LPRTVPLARPRRFAIVRPVHRSRGFIKAMAHDDSHYTPGSMDISQHKRAYAGFLTGAKWTFALVMGIVIFMAIFRTHN